MALFTLWEIVQIIITILAIGFIFSGIIKKPKHPFEELLKSRFFDWEDIKYSIIITSPAIILHEFGHKFVGFAMGYVSRYEIWTPGLGIGVVLRLIGSRFMFLAPGYVKINGIIDNASFGLIAFAGPLVNIILFGLFWALLKFHKYPQYHQTFYISKQINLLLFAFNMLPIPLLDGFKVYRGIADVLGLI